MCIFTSCQAGADGWKAGIFLKPPSKTKEVPWKDGKI